MTLAHQEKLGKGKNHIKFNIKQINRQFHHCQKIALIIDTNHLIMAMILSYIMTVLEMIIKTKIQIKIIRILFIIFPITLPMII